MAKHPITPKKCANDHRGSFIKANNNTTQYTYFWCPIDRIVHKDTNFDGVIE